MLRLWLEQQVLPEFSGRTLPVDTAVAQRCARLHVPNKRGERDALIAATALVHGMTVATRNVADFQHTGVVLINPGRYRSNGALLHCRASHVVKWRRSFS